MTETVTIRAIASGGDGVGALADGRTVFVPRSAPGDMIELTAVRRQARFARASIGVVREPGPDRVTPPCPHYLAQQCGGCQLMHLSGEAQSRIKATIAGDALRRLGGMEMADPAIVPAVQPLHYRTKMTLAMRDGRLGYHPLGEPGNVFDLRECLLVEPTVRDLHAAVSRHRGHLPRATSKVVFRRDREGGNHVVVETTHGGWRDAGRLLRESGVNAAIWWRPAGGAAQLMDGAAGAGAATIFEQVNPLMAREVRQHALRALGEVASRHVWDLYAGIGETTRALAEQGAAVTSVERDADAVAWAERLGPAGPQRRSGDVAQLLGGLTRPDLIITNPPRVGMAGEVVDAIAGSGAERVVYISCDPATLARDLKRMSGAYAPASVVAFDQFPQTAHLEAVAVLTRI